MSHIKNRRMIFKHPGTMFVHNGNKFDYLIIEHDDADAHVALGWSVSMEDALAKGGDSEPDDTDDESEDTPPTRAELEEQCKKLGIKVDGRYSDRRLLALIAEKMG